MALSETMKRHIARIGELHTTGHAVYHMFEGYIDDCAKEKLVVPDDAQEIYETFIDNSGRPAYSNADYKQSHMYKTQISKIKRIIQNAIDKRLIDVVVKYHSEDDDG